MFLKKLLIKSEKQVIREIDFHLGLNLIVDRSVALTTSTGNNVGKTTVLRLIDFCFGANQSVVYRDPEDTSKIFKKVKDFLENHKVTVKLFLAKDFDDDHIFLTLEKNFTAVKKDEKHLINGKDLETNMKYMKELRKLIYGSTSSDNPSFRDLITHNIRIESPGTENTLKVLNQYKTDIDYETLHLFMFGCPNNVADEKKKLSKDLAKEKNYLSKLQKNRKLDDLKRLRESALRDIARLKKIKEDMVINEDYKKDLDKANQLKHKLSQCSQKYSNYILKRDIINDMIKDLKKESDAVNVNELKSIYEQAKAGVGKLSKTFEDLLQYHNKMINERILNLKSDLPMLEDNIKKELNRINGYEVELQKLNQVLKGASSLDEYEKIISNMSSAHEKLGEYNALISEITKASVRVNTLEKELKEIGDKIYHEDFKAKLDKNIDYFNSFYEEVSSKLYSEKYLLSAPIEITSKGKKYYDFKIIDTENFSTGKKQGESLCFDIAYTMFADEIKLNTLHFLLNDKKELLHINQLALVDQYIREKNIQLIWSILYDKIKSVPELTNRIILELSEDDKLFRIEELSNN